MDDFWLAYVHLTLPFDRIDREAISRCTPCGGAWWVTVGHRCNKYISLRVRTTEDNHRMLTNASLCVVAGWVYIYRIDVVERTEPSGRGIKCLGLAFMISPSRKGALHIVGQGDIISGLEYSRIDDMREKKNCSLRGDYWYYNILSSA